MVDWILEGKLGYEWFNIVSIFFENLGEEWMLVEGFVVGFDIGGFVRKDMYCSKLSFVYLKILLMELVWRFLVMLYGIVCCGIGMFGDIVLECGCMKVWIIDNGRILLLLCKIIVVLRRLLWSDRLKFLMLVIFFYYFR